jgi:ABC-type cobalamin transport system permease subunit
MTAPGRAIDLDAAPVSRALLSLVCGVLALPGSTVAWALPAGGLWIGAPLAVAAIVLGRIARRAGPRDRRAVAGIALGVLCLGFMAVWSIATVA